MKVVTLTYLERQEIEILPPLSSHTSHQPSQRGRRRRSRAVGLTMSEFFRLPEDERAMVNEMSKVGRRRGPRTKE